MLKHIFVMAAMTAGLLGASAAAAQTHPVGHPSGHLPGVKVVNLHRAYLARLGHTKPGKVSGVVYARGTRPKAARTRAAQCTEPACPLVYQPNNGPVQVTPHVYLLLWGPNWGTDSGQEASASYLESFYAGLGASGDIWSGITSQYEDSAGGSPGFGSSVYVGAFNDTTTPPTGATQAEIAAEADTFAASQGITDLTDAQVVVATQSGTCPAGFAGSLCGGTGTNCGWHSSSAEPYINLPYLLDAGAACGEDFVNSGISTAADDGFSLVGGDEYADTITDPFPSTGAAPGTAPNPAWVDTGDTVSGGEVASKCQFGQSFNGGAPDTDMALATGAFAMQSLWSNSANGCVMSTQPKDTMTVTSPGSVSDSVGSTVNLQLQASSSGGFLITWRASGLPAGLSLDSSTGKITGTPNTAANYAVTITATDETGARRGVSFNWTVSPAGGEIKAANGKCLDDSGAGTTKGTKADIWKCNNTSAQKWTFNSNGTLEVLGLCLADHNYTGTGTKLVLWTCVGNRNEQWTHKSNGEYVLAVQGLCLTDPSGSTTNGTQVQIRTCQNFKDQHWSLP